MSSPTMASTTSSHANAADPVPSGSIAMASGGRIAGTYVGNEARVMVRTSRTSSSLSLPRPAPPYIGPRSVPLPNPFSVRR
jgi:hypothetical protein